MASAAITSWDRQRRRAFFWGLFPALAVLAVITVAPAVYLVVTSLTPLNLTNTVQTGLDFSDPL
ncbi:MAG: sugar ABC transporter permease, partial [Geminicoccaceae bacterium]|nr:sugar ABC transporter permease [Geminicoccaceae bacterium]